MNVSKMLRRRENGKWKASLPHPDHVKHPRPYRREHKHLADFLRMAEVAGIESKNGKLEHQQD